MKSPYRALIWEQLRTAGVLCGALSLCSILAFIAAYLERLLRFDYGKSSSEVYSGYILFFALIGAIIFIVRRDFRGHLVLGFDARLFRLPVSVPVLFAVVLGARTGALLLLLGFQKLLIMTLPFPSVRNYGRSAYYLLCAFLLLQALAWSYRRIPVIMNAMVSLLVLAMLGCRILGYTPTETFLFFKAFVAHPVTGLLLPPLALLVLYTSVVLERQDRYFGPPGLLRLLGRSAQLLTFPLHTPSTPFKAQYWYETRRIGWLLPALTVGYTALITTIMIAIEKRPLGSGLGQYIPLAALIIAALEAGATGIFPRSRMSDQRAISDSDLALARLLAQLRALFLAVITAGILSLIFLLASPMERMIMTGFQEEGLFLLADMVIVVLRPLVLAGMTAWVVLWLLSSPMALACLGIPCGISLLVILTWILPFIPDTGSSFFFYCNTVMMLTLTGVLFLEAWLRSYLAARQLLALLLLWGVLFSFLWMGSRSLHDATGALFAGVCSAYLVLPAASLLWTLRKQRHDVSIRSLYT